MLNPSLAKTEGKPKIKQGKIEENLHAHVEAVVALVALKFAYFGKSLFIGDNYNSGLGNPGPVHYLISP